jgi:hypothetical protein
VKNNGIWLLNTQDIGKNVYGVEEINVMTGREEWRLRMLVFVLVKM